MTLPLIHLKGNSGLPGFVRAHTGNPSKIVYVTGCQIIIVDEEDRRQQQFLRGHTDPITGFALSHSGNFVASAQSGRNADVLLWDAQSGAQLTRFSEHDHEVLGLAFSQDDKLLLSVGSNKDQRLFVLDTSNGKIVTKHVLEYGKRVSACAFAPSAGDVYNFAVAFGQDVTIFSLNPYTSMLSLRPVVTGSVRRQYTQLVFSADGQWLYAGTTTGDVVTINVLRAAVQMTHPACSNGIGAMILSSTGRLLVGGGDGTITLLSNDHLWRDMRPFVTVPGVITSLSPNLDGSALIVGTADGSILRVASGVFSIIPISQAPSAPVSVISASVQAPNTYAAVLADGRTCIYNMQDHGLRQVIQADPTAGQPLALDIAQGVIVSGWADGAVRAHALQTEGTILPGIVPPKCVTSAAWTLAGAHTFAHSCGVTALKVAHRGNVLATGGQGGELRVWSWRSREMVSHMKLHGSRINNLQILADDNHLVAACEDHSLSAWDINTQKCRATWRLSTPIRGVAVCPDQVTLASVGHEKHLSVWDLRVPDPVLTITNAHDNIIGAVAANPTNSLIATGGADSAVKLWDLRCGQDAVSCTPLATGLAHTGPINSLMFHPSGALLSGSADGTVGIWQP